MATRVVKFYLFLALVAAVAFEAKAQSSSTATSCMSAIMSITPCARYIAGNSTAPSPQCCSAMTSMVQTNPECLCSVIDSSGAGAVLGIVINQTLALSLPSSCNIQTSLTQCTATDANPPSPSVGDLSPSSSLAPTVDSPMASPDDEPLAPSSDYPSGSGLNTIPSFSWNTSGSSITKSTVHLVALLLTIASWTSYVALF